MKSYICYGLYTLIAKHCPSIRNTYDGISEKIRYFLVKGYIQNCGKCVNIQSNPTIARRVCIGDYSGVGRNSLIQGG